MSDDLALELVRRFNSVFVSRDWDELDSLLAPGFVAHNGDNEVRGADGWRRFVEESWEQFGAVQTDVVEAIGDGGLLAERWTWRAGDPRGHGITLHRVADGRLQENWGVFAPDAD
jgi:predicted SnoaL-like aldol condensation-catalyzing enzyme